MYQLFCNDFVVGRWTTEPNLQTRNYLLQAVKVKVKIMIHQIPGPM